uniref:Uncharacterized protein n=1 Tax=viral metagenome TaxID=1070528 RepID=A0A6M3KZ57_9ZZZZ
MKEIIEKQKELIEYLKCEIKSILGAIEEEALEKGIDINMGGLGDNMTLHTIESELAVLEAEQGTGLPPVEQSSQGEGMMSAKDYCCEWHDKKYGGCKEIGDWSPDDVMEFAEEYAAKKMLNILPKQNIPKECTLCKYHPTNNRW